MSRFGVGDSVYYHVRHDHYEPGTVTDIGDRRGMYFVSLGDGTTRYAPSGRLSRASSGSSSGSSSGPPSARVGPASASSSFASSALAGSVGRPGNRVSFDGRPGWITGGDATYLNVRFNGDTDPTSIALSPATRPRFASFASQTPTTSPTASQTPTTSPTTTVSGDIASDYRDSWVGRENAISFAPLVRGAYRLNYGEGHSMYINPDTYDGLVSHRPSSLPPSAVFLNPYTRSPVYRQNLSRLMKNS